MARGVCALAGSIILRAHKKKEFGAIPNFLVIADYEKAFLYVTLK
jgi:hypothetical protein